MGLLSSSEFRVGWGCPTRAARPRLDPLGKHDQGKDSQTCAARGSMGSVHELSLCEAIAGVVRPHAAGRHVDVIRVQVGALRQVVPESLEFCWSLIRDYQDMPDAQLELEFVSAEVVCRSCGQRGAIESRWSVCCPGCTSADVEVVRGNEFLVTSLDVT
jgi:hydrogenase nickel incorporation protein HypA/HybF